MTQITIPAQVVNGQLQHEQSLAELEGQHVLVALVVVPTDSANGNRPMTPVPQVQADELWPQPELVWSERSHRARTGVEKFTREPNTDS